MPSVRRPRRQRYRSEPGSCWSAAGGVRRNVPSKVGLLAGGGVGSARRTCLITSLTARTTRRVACNTPTWCMAVGQTSASAAGYRRASSVMTSAGSTPAARRRSRNALTIPWSTSWVLGSTVEPTRRSPAGVAGSMAIARVRRGKSGARIVWQATLRQVRRWLSPWARLRLYWQSWSTAPPPPDLAALLEHVAHSRPLDTPT